MKALLLKDYHRLSYEDMPTPEAAADEVLVAVRACGICGSDVHGIDGSTGRRRPPIVMGHEASGVIAAVGPAVRGWSVGDRVTFDSTVYCGDCHFCRRNLVNLCDNRRVLGVSCAEYRRHGALAEYVTVPQRILYRLPPAVTFAQAAMTETLSIAVHAAAISPLSTGDTALIMGSGMIGLLLVQVLRARGCGRVIAVDIEPRKLDLARQFGADVTIRGDKDDVPASVRRETEGRGTDVAFELVGNTPALTTAIDSVRKGGCITLIGNLATQVQVPLQAVVTREITIRGSCASCLDFPACLEMIAGGAAKVDPLISAVAPLSEGAAWFDRLYRKEAGLMKVVLDPSR